MPKSKNALALLEVLRRGDMRPGAGDSNDAPPGQPAQPDAPQVSAARGRGSQALVRTDGDRLKFSVSTLTLAMVLLAAFVLLAGAFALGRRLGYDSGWQAAGDRALMVAETVQTSP